MLVRWHGATTRLHRLVAAAFVALAWGLAAMSPGVAQAHPHAVIDVHSEVQLDEAGRVSGISEVWLFDEFYTAMVLDDMAGGQRQPKPAAVQTLVDTILENLSDYSYFTRAKSGSAAVKLAPAQSGQGELTGRRLKLSFRAPLVQPVDPVAQPFEYAIYDPTYYIQMMHRPLDGPVVHGTGPQGSTCSAYVVAPRPSPRDIARAYAMDRGAPADDRLGRLFAERVQLRCQ